MLRVSGTFLICLTLCSLKMCNSQLISDLKALRTKLFTTNDYDTKMRPVTKQSDVIVSLKKTELYFKQALIDLKSKVTNDFGADQDVNVRLELHNLNQIDDLEETMTVTAYIHLAWTDEELTWTPSSYGNIYTIFFPKSSIWTPDIAVKNSYGKSNEIGFDSLNGKISSTGAVSWTPYQQIMTTCSLNIRKYPFDEQNCEIILTSWSYSIFHMTFRNTSEISTQNYVESPSWKLKSTSVASRMSVNFSPELVYTLNLQRKPTYMVLTIICPIILLAVLDVFVFLVPASSGEKAGYAVTVLLALAVFLTVVDSSMPKSSETVPIFTLYVIILIVQSTLITMLSIVLVKCVTYDQRQVPVPRALKGLSNLFECKPCKKSKNRVENIEKTGDKMKEATKKEPITCYNDENEPTWADVVNSLDKFFFLLFTFVIVLTTVVFTGIITT